MGSREILILISLDRKIRTPRKTASFSAQQIVDKTVLKLLAQEPRPCDVQFKTEHYQRAKAATFIDISIFILLKRLGPVVRKARAVRSWWSTCSGLRGRISRCRKIRR